MFSFPIEKNTRGILAFLFGLLAIPWTAYTEESSSKVDELAALESKKAISESPECTPPKKGTKFKTVPIASAFQGTSGEVLPEPKCVGPENQLAGEGIVVGDYYLENNAWNGHRSSWKWSQCVEIVKNQDGSFAAGWRYDWGDEDSLVDGFYEWEVKSYPRLVFGQRPGVKYKDSCSSSGLPLSYSKLPKFQIDYTTSGSITKTRKGDIGKDDQIVFGGEYNLAVTSLFYSNCTDIGVPHKLPEFLMMIWLKPGPERTPSGEPPKIELFKDSLGQEFYVYTKTDFTDDRYLAFYAKDRRTNGTIIWNDFANYVKVNSKKLELNQFRDDWCLANIMIGTEIWWGEGTFKLHKFDITRTY